MVTGLKNKTIEKTIELNGDSVKAFNGDGWGEAKPSKNHWCQWFLQRKTLPSHRSRKMTIAHLNLLQGAGQCWPEKVCCCNCNLCWKEDGHDLLLRFACIQKLSLRLSFLLGRGQSEAWLPSNKSQRALYVDSVSTTLVETSERSSAIQTGVGPGKRFFTLQSHYL